MKIHIAGDEFRCQYMIVKKLSPSRILFMGVIVAHSGTLVQAMYKSLFKHIQTTSERSTDALNFLISTDLRERAA